MSEACAAPAGPWPVWAAAAGLVVSCWLVPRLEALVGDSGLTRNNWRGIALPTGVGVALPVAGAAGATLASLASGTWPGAAAGLGLVTAAALFGLLDDLTDRGGGHGWTVHTRGLLRGPWTGGTAKLVGISAAALAAGVFCAGSPGSLGWLATAAAGLIGAGTANLINLADTRPGRALKIWYLAVIILGTAGSAAASAWLYPWAVLALPLLARDLAEGAMLGDAGSNALGAALGLGLVLAVRDPAHLLVLAPAVTALQVLGDRRSLHAWIEGQPWLRALDGLGRHRPPAAGNLLRPRE